MRRKINVLQITFCASAIIHAGFLFFIVNSETLAGASKPEPLPEAFSLVNIAALPEPFVPEPPPEPPVIPVTVPELPPDDRPAEDFIAVEEIPPAGETPPVLMPTTAIVPVRVEGAGRAETAAARPSAGTGNNAALTETYVKRNFNYIQRRIRDRLVYPPQARRAGIQGVAEVNFTIHIDGTVSGVMVKVTSGQEILDQAAIEAVHAAAPFPSPPVPARIAIPIAFRLR
jgi:protein TonB